MHLIKITILMADGSSQKRYATSRQDVAEIASRYVAQTPGAVHELRRCCELDISEHRAFLVAQAQQMHFLALALRKSEVSIRRAAGNLSTWQQHASALPCRN